MNFRIVDELDTTSEHYVVRLELSCRAPCWAASSMYHTEDGEPAKLMMINAAEPDARWSYRAGSISALILVIGYSVIIALYVRVGAPPSGVEARLGYLARNTTIWWAIIGLSVLTDLLFVPVALALYATLRSVNRNVMLLATACVGLFIGLDLAITWTNYAALVTLSSEYAKAASEAQRAVIVAAATYPSVVLESSLLFFYNSLLLSVGILMTGAVMLNGIFGKSIAYLGVATGILGVVSVVGPVFINALRGTIILTSALTTVWLLLVGFRLYRLARN